MAERNEPADLDPGALVSDVLQRLSPSETLPPRLERLPAELWQHGVRLAGLGKAAVEQVDTARAWFESQEVQVEDLLAVTKHGHGPDNPSFRVLHAAHPICDASSRHAAAELVRFAHETPDRRPFVLCLSGGGSALAAEAREPFSFEQKIEAFRQLVDRGAPIADTNLIRREMSAFKNGGLRVACGTRPVVTLVTSDVPGQGAADAADPMLNLDLVASGPTLHRSIDPVELREVANRWLDPDLARAIVAGVTRPERAAWNQQLAAAAGDEDHLELVASYRQLIDETCAWLSDRRFRTIPILEACDAPIGDGVDIHLERIAQWPTRGAATAWVSAGEYPTRVRGPGRGGRNTEFVVRMGRALWLENRLGLSDELLDRLTVLSLATDGGDGPTDSAGGWLTRTALRRGLDTGADLDAALEGSDTLTFLEACGSALRTGPTATNLMDLHVIAIS